MNPATPNQPLKIAIVVQGRFHAFDLARGLLGKGHDVTLFTNYPRFIAARFGLPKPRVRSFLSHGALSSVVYRLRLQEKVSFAERFIHTVFGRWACRQLGKEHWDVIYSWSGISEEILNRIPPAQTVRLLVRGSAHIQSQADLLNEEERRTGVLQEKPSDWRIQRELREYAKADAVVVLSSFCRQTFLEQGFPEERLRLMVSGTRVDVFRPCPEVIEERCRRLLSGAPLRILNVGTFSYRKGMFDLAQIVRSLDRSRFQYRFVGAIHREAAELAASLSSAIEFEPRKPQSELPAEYASADIFLFPTIEDGFPAVMAQAAAAGLPMLTTPNGAGRDLVREGETGWVLPIRDPAAFVERLAWCDQHRDELARMARRVYDANWQRDWPKVADDFVAISGEFRRRKSNAGAAPPQTGLMLRGKMAIVAPGRFFAFDLARELSLAGVDVTVFTNYPTRVVERFGLPRERARTCLRHGLLSRGLGLIDGSRRFEPSLHRWFSSWAARMVSSGSFDRVHCFSGVAEELFLSLNGSRVRKSLIRGSAHIDLQSQLLREEASRVGREIEVPSDWMIAREKREYALADEVVVLSSFAWRSFIDRGFRESKLRLLPLGAELLRFRPEPVVIERRCQRILSGRPLRVLTVGAFSYQKGVVDLVQIARQLAGRCEFRFVGAVAREAVALRKEASGWIEFVPKQPERRLPEFYEWGDVFVFPTIHDGYAVVLAQAQAAGLPVLTTTNCAGPDLVMEGQTGWILPIRSAAAFVERLEQCAQNRHALAATVRAVYEKFRPRDWRQVAADFVAQHQALDGARHNS